MTAPRSLRGWATLAASVTLALGLTISGAPAALAAPSGGWTLDAPGWGWEVVPGEGVWYSSPNGTHLVVERDERVAAHAALGGGRGALGYPTSGTITERRPSPLVGGWVGWDYQTFERGVLYSPNPAWTSPNTPAVTLTSSAIARYHAATGGAGGPLGLPLANEAREAPGYWHQVFLSGIVYASPHGIFGVRAGADIEHRSQGGGGGALGYPVGARTWDGPRFSHQRFQRGVVYCVATYESERCSSVRGGFLPVHAERGGGRGALGYPLGNESRDSATGAWSQVFERGIVTIAGSTVTVQPR